METYKEVVYPDEQEFWTGDPLFTYLGDCDIVMSSSIRNIGKTYAVFDHLRNHIAKGHNVAVSRYDRVELGVTISDFLRYYEYKDEDGNTVEGYRRIQNKIKDTPYHCFEIADTGARVYFFAVKDSPNLKGLEIKNLYRWYIDEFVPISYKVQTRKYAEFDYFRELYHTLVRTNENLKVILTANVKKWANPYYMGWGIPKFPSGNIMKIVRNGMRIAVENVKASKGMERRFVKAERLMGTDERDIRRMLKDYDSDPDCFVTDMGNLEDTGVQTKIHDNVYGVYTKRGQLYFRRENEDTGKAGYLLTPIEIDRRFIYEPQFVKNVEKCLELNNCRFESRKCEFDIRLGVWLSHTHKI